MPQQILNMKNIEKDPYLLGVPNINFSLLDKGDSRHGKGYRNDRITRGFDDSETWSLDYTIACFTIPRLERYLEIYKESIDDSIVQLIPKMEKMLIAFKLITRDGGSRLFSKEEKEQLQEGLDLLSKYLLHLWW